MNDKDFQEKIEIVGKILQIKRIEVQSYHTDLFLAHIVGLHPDGKGGKILYGPGDLEGHLGTDGRRYLVNFTHYCPPEPPIINTPALGNTILYRLLRPGNFSRQKLR